MIRLTGATGIAFALALTAAAQPNVDVSLGEAQYQFVYLTSDFQNDIVGGAADASAGPATASDSLSIPEPLGGTHDMQASTTANFSGFTYSGSGSAFYQAPSSRDATGTAPGTTASVSEARIVFQVNNPIEFFYSYSGSATASGIAAVDLGSSFRFQLTDLDVGGPNIIEEEVLFTSSATSFGNPGASIMLNPGTYQARWNALVISGNSFGYDSETVNYTFGASIVPAPSAAALLGLAGLAATRRRR